MYWIYLCIFIIAVMTPMLIQGDLTLVSEEGAEQLAILVLGTFGFLLFLWQERQSLKNRKEKNQAQRVVNQISRDLTESYSYIGELNRKIDIFQDVVSSLPEYFNIHSKHDREAFGSILHAVRVLLGTDQFVVCFCNPALKQVERTIKLNPEFSVVGKNDIPWINERKINDRRVLIVDSTHDVGGIRATAIVARKRDYNPADIEIVKALLAQALAYYMFVRHMEEDLKRERRKTVPLPTKTT